MNTYATARTVADSIEYAKRRANETGRAYAVWTVAGRPDLWWAAMDCAANRRCYVACGATDRKTIRPTRTVGGPR